MHSSPMLLAFAVFGFLTQPAFAQTSNAVCLPYYQWAFNTQKKSPCEVASSLQAVCNGGAYDVPALPDQNHYNGPSISTANPCQCNTVTYSLMSACGACQGRTFLSWSAWSANCPNVSIGTYPAALPMGTLVPGWAYENVTATDMFDQSSARDNANGTESSAIPPASSSTFTFSKASSTASVSASMTIQTSTEAVTESASAASPTPNIAHANAVGAGAVVGLLGGLILIGIIAYWILRRRRRASTTHLTISSSIASRESNHPSQAMSQYQGTNFSSNLSYPSATMRPAEYSA